MTLMSSVGNGQTQSFQRDQLCQGSLHQARGLILLITLQAMSCPITCCTKMSTCHPTSQICHSHTLVNLTQRAMASPAKGALTTKWVVCTCESSGCKDKTFINEHGASQTGHLIAHSTRFDHWTKDHLTQLNSEVCECLIIVVACLPGFVGQTK